jgi:hypothetical protein
MIRLQATPLNSLADAQARLQTAIALEFSTLPVYLYAKFSILPDSNGEAAASLSMIVGQEMIHMCLACNILNAIGGKPILAGKLPDGTIVPPLYPGPLPGDIGGLTVGLLPFSEDAMRQGMAIEEPEDPLDFPVAAGFGAAAGPPLTIGQFYAELDAFLAQLDPNNDWQTNNNQIDDAQFFAGQLFPVNTYQDAHRAISIIVSEGEGAKNTPLDFANEVSHFYRFEEIARNLVLTKADNPQGYAWGPASFGVDWSSAYPAIPNPGQHDFSGDPPAAAAQDACNAAFTLLVDELQRAVNGEQGRLGYAVRAMFELRMAAIVALTTPLADSDQVAGPAFLYKPRQQGAAQ